MPSVKTLFTTWMDECFSKKKGFITDQCQTDYSTETKCDFVNDSWTAPANGYVRFGNVGSNGTFGASGWFRVGGGGAVQIVPVTKGVTYSASLLDNSTRDRFFFCELVGNS